MSWHKESFLEDIGLAPQNGKPFTREKLHIDKGEVDPRSSGAAAVISKSLFDKHGRMKELDIRYWCVFPDGRFEKQHLFQIEMEPAGKDKIDVKSIHILGRAVSLHDSRAVNNVLEAIRRLHVDLRNTDAKLPHITEIFKACDLENIVGEKLPLPGFHLQQRLYFSPMHDFNIAARTEERPVIKLPLEAFQPLMGMRTNTLDTDHGFMTHKFMRARGVIPQIGGRFEMQSELHKTDKGSSKLRVKMRSVDDMNRDTSSRVIAKSTWMVGKAGKNEDGPDMALIKTLKIFDQSMLTRSYKDVMGAIGVMNRVHADMFNARDYPRMLDHLADYNLLDTVQTSSEPPPAQGRFVLTSIGGNNLREIYPGVGDSIGGNCKTLETQWIDPRTRDIKKLGVILDLGAYLIRQQSEWTAAHPDVVEKLKFSRHIFISHHHLDHLDALIPYIKFGLIGAQHRVYLTPDVYEMLHDKLTKMGIKKDDPRRPQIHMLEDTGVIDICDDKCIKRISVAYGVNAVPHSAKGTPFIVYGRSGDTILGSYMYLGDIRYDPEWLKLHPSLFWDPAALMQKHDPTLEADALIPTYAELDATSIKREGRSASEQQVEDHLTRILSQWFHDRHAGIAIIGTNDGRRESLLRIGNRAERKMTAFGAAVEFLFRIANKHGVNTYRTSGPAAGSYTGIEDYLEWHAAQNDLEPTQYVGRDSKTVKSWFENDEPGSIMAILSGSQGNPIEFEAMTYKLADRRSLWDADPSTIKTARPVNLKDWVLIFSQGAIPGNAKYQRELIRKLADRGASVLESYDDHLRIHNPGLLKNRIIKDLARSGQSAWLEADGALLVENMPIHASGHGRKADMAQWIKRLNSKFFGLYHTDDRESVMAGYELIEECGKRHPGGIFENSVEVEITQHDVKAIGRIVPSIILSRTMAEPGKHFNQTIEATRVVSIDEKSPHHELGQRGTVGGSFETHFGMEDPEDIKRREKTGGSAQAVFAAAAAQDVCAKPPRVYRGLKAIVAPPWPQPLAA